MNYQGGIGTLGGIGGSTAVAGIAILPNTGSISILRYVALAAVITGVTLVVLHLGAVVYRRRIVRQ